MDNSQESNSTKELARAGDVNISEVVIISRSGTEFDIKNIVAEINIFEDMFSPIMTGNIVISDGSDLINTLPIIGEELIRLRIGTPTFEDDDEIYKTFKIYAITDKTAIFSDRTQAYTLHFISQEGYIDSIARVNGTFSGNTNDVVSRLFDSFVKMARNTVDGVESRNETELTLLDNTKNIITFNSPSWSPFKCINYVASRSLRDDNYGSNFVFFETNKGFVFGSIQELIDMQTKQDFLFARYIYAPADVSVPNGNPESLYKRPSLEHSYNLVEEFITDEDFNLLNSNLVGHLSNRVVTYDIVNKQMKVNDYDYLTEWDKYKHVDKNSKSKTGSPIVSERQLRAANTCIMMEPQHPFLFNGNKDTTNKDIDKIVSSRMSMLADITTRKMSIIVPGRTDIECGMLTEFILPAFKTKDLSETKEDVEDKFYSGTYLITAVRHKITPAKHMMRIELSKDSIPNKK